MPFRLLEKIGDGKFADIYKIEDEKGKTFAFKSVPANKLKYIELDILARLRSPYIIRSIDPKITHFNERYGIVEKLEDNDLTKLKISKLPYVQLKRIIISAIYGLRCMHKKGFLHLDVSRSNILYGKDNEENYCAYLTDFGWSVRCNDAYKGIMSTKVIKYKNTPIEALEATNNKEGVKMRKYSDKSDIWSMGIVIMELLGARFHFDETETYVKHMKSITDSFIEEKIRHYNDKKMSNNEELYLKELLVNMLKIDVKERISSRDITRLKFFKTTNRLLNLNEECVLEKPTELVFLPYISPLTTDGIRKIKNYYLVNSARLDCIKIEEYFLAIQVFLRLMSKTKPYINEEELQELVREAVYVASNYYDRRSDQGSYKIAEELKSEIGYNFYYSADYLEDLVILNHYILEGNKDLLGFYNLFNIKKLFEFFREGYNYKDRKRNSVSLHEFLEMDIPTKKDNEEVSFLTALDYHEIIADDETYSLVKKYKDIEKYTSKEYNVKPREFFRLYYVYIDYFSIHILGIPVNNFIKFLETCGMELIDDRTREIKPMCVFLVPEMSDEIVEGKPKYIKKDGKIIDTTNGKEVVTPEEPTKLIGRKLRESQDLLREEILSSDEETELTEFPDVYRFGIYCYIKVYGKDITRNILRDKTIDPYFTCSNNVIDVMNYYGIESARLFFIREYNSINDIQKMNSVNIELLVDFQTTMGHILSVTSTDIAKHGKSALVAASFEQPLEAFKKSSSMGTKDIINNIPSCLMTGKQCTNGTGIVEVEFTEEYKENKFSESEEKTITLLDVEQKEIMGGCFAAGNFIKSSPEEDEDKEVQEALLQTEDMENPKNSFNGKARALLREEITEEVSIPEVDIEEAEEDNSLLDI